MSWTQKELPSPSGEEKNEHDNTVRNLKEKLVSKGFKIMSLQRREAAIAHKGYRVTKPKIPHIAFGPDIIMSGTDKPEDRFFIEYVHTEERFVHDLRGMMLLSRVVKARGFILIINDSICEYSKGISKKAGDIHPMPLNIFLKALDSKSKEEFPGFLIG